VAAVFVCVGVSHKQAPIKVREQLAVPGEAMPQRLQQLRNLPGVRETLLLSTCNRLEIWAAADDASAGADIVATLGPLAAPHAFVHQNEAALRHLFRVASSLDSMVVGEAQILGQVKDAAAVATQAGVFGSLLGRALARATSAAKRVRTETSIARGAVSISSVAVELAAKVLGDLRGKVPLLLGAGEMALLAARELRSSGATQLLVANRTLERAQELTAETGGIAVSFAELNSLLERADVVICSTGAREPIVTREQMVKVVKARRHRPVFFVDLSLPRNVEPSVNELDNVYVYDLDDLEQVANRNRDLRRGEVDKAEQIVEQELQALFAEQRERSGVPVLARLRSKAQSIADVEVERLLAQLGPLSDKQQKSVRAMAAAMVNKLLHQPTARLRAEAGHEGAHPPRSLADAAAELFSLEDEPAAAVHPPAQSSGAAAAPADGASSGTPLSAKPSVRSSAPPAAQAAEQGSAAAKGGERGTE
jgi:glutamyl-tRNA reductase